VGANAYATHTEFNAHHVDRAQITTNEFTQAQIEPAIVAATDYIDKRFGRRFRGFRKSGTQGLEWPRLDAYDDDDFLLSGVPAALKKATVEYAWVVLRLERNLAPIPGNEFAIVDPDTGEATSEVSGIVTGKTETVGPITEATQYQSFAGSGAHPMTSTGNLIQRIPEYPQADLWMEELLLSAFGRSVRRG